MAKSVGRTENGKWMISPNVHPQSDKSYTLEIYPYSKEDDLNFKINMIFDDDGIDVYITDQSATPENIIAQEFDIASGLKGGFFVGWDDLGIEKRSYKELRYSYTNDGADLSIGFKNKQDEELPSLPYLIKISNKDNMVSVANLYPHLRKEVEMNISKVFMGKQQEKNHQMRM